MDFRVNLDVGGLDYSPESETHGGTTRTIVSDKDFQASLKKEMRRRLSKAGADFEAVVAYDHTREAQRNIQRWYQQSKLHPTPPTI